MPQLVSRWRQKTIVATTDRLLCLCSGRDWRRGAACGRAVCGSAVAGRALPALHEGGGKAGPTEPKVRPEGRDFLPSSQKKKTFPKCHDVRQGSLFSPLVLYS